MTKKNTVLIRVDPYFYDWGNTVKENNNISLAELTERLCKHKNEIEKIIFQVDVYEEKIKK
jgi:hypothetical protein